MNSLNYKSFSCVAASILAIATVFSPTSLYAQEAVGGASPPAGFKKTMPRATLKEATSASEMSLNIVLDPITAGEKAELGSSFKGQPLKVGVGRDVPAPYAFDISPSLNWKRAADGGLTASFSVHSPDAEAIRISLLLKTPLDEAIEFRFFGFGPRKQVFGPVTPVKMGQPAARDEVVSLNSKADPAAFQKSKKEESLLYWSPVVEGDTIGVEIYLPPSVDPASFSLAVPSISHLGVSLLNPDTKSLSEIGASASCHIDIACRPTFPSDLGNATAKFISTDGGTSFLCTGTLMNDRETGTSIPYFLTANHCLSMQTVANTVNTFWFFEKASCGGANPTTVTQFTDGAELLATGESTDYTFLELYDRAIASLDNITFSGWDPIELSSNTTVVGIHHPRGDLKKWSQGIHTGFANPGEAVNGTGMYMRILWSEGTTEQGSSGSGLFYYNAELNQDLLVGTLHGGLSSCSSPDSPDWYGRFDMTYPNIRRWLDEQASELTAGVTVSSSVAVGQWKEYKIVSDPPTSEVTVELTDLSSDADLYVRKESRPNLNSTGYDCRPFLADTSSETCKLNNSGSNTYFIGVYGATAGSFSLKATPTESAIDSYHFPIRGFTGSWYNPAHEGEGANVEVLPDGTTVFYYYAYFDDGTPLFLTGVLTAPGVVKDYPEIPTGIVYLSRGGALGATDPSKVNRIPLALAGIAFIDCGNAKLFFWFPDEDGNDFGEDGNDLGEADIVFSMERLTPPVDCAVRRFPKKVIPTS